MNLRETHWPRLLAALRQDTTLSGQWSQRQEAGRLQLIVASAFHETWVRLRHSALLAPLLAGGILELRQRRVRRRPGRQPLRGDWNRLAAHLLEQVRDGVGGMYLITGAAGAGKTFLARALLGSEQRIWPVRRLGRLVAHKRHEGELTEFVREIKTQTVFVLDDAHHLLDHPALARWLGDIFDSRHGAPVVALGRSGPGLDQLPVAIASRLRGGVVAAIDYPDVVSRRQLAQASCLEARVHPHRDLIAALTSRPSTPGRLKHVVACLKRAPVAVAQAAPLVRELLRTAHADDLSLLFRHICARHGVAGGDLRSRRRPDNLQRAREEYAHLAMAAGWSPTEIALVLGRSVSSVRDLAGRGAAAGPGA